MRHHAESHRLHICSAILCLAVTAATLFTAVVESSGSDTVPLVLYYGSKQTDNFTTGTDAGAGAAERAKYRKVRIEGYAFSDERPGTVPLKLYWHKGRTDNFSAATSSGAQYAEGHGYRYVRIQGYIYRAQEPGTAPLKLYLHEGRGDNFTTATEAGASAAERAGYEYVRIEGYVLKEPVMTTGQDMQLQLAGVAVPKA